MRTRPRIRLACVVRLARVGNNSEDTSVWRRRRGKHRQRSACRAGRNRVVTVSEAKVPNRSRRLRFTPRGQGLASYSDRIKSVDLEIGMTLDVKASTDCPNNPKRVWLWRPAG